MANFRVLQNPQLQAVSNLDMEYLFCIRTRQLRRCFTILILLSPIPLYLLLYLNGVEVINLKLKQIQVFLINPNASKNFAKAVHLNDIVRPPISNGSFEKKHDVGLGNNIENNTPTSGVTAEDIEINAYMTYEHRNIFNDREFDYRLTLTAEEQRSIVLSNRSKIFLPQRKQMPITEKEIDQYEHLDLLGLKAPKFQPKFKNPCWHDENKLLRCLPYFYLIGAPKCGTTDLYNKFMDYLFYFSKLSEQLNNAKLGKDQKKQLITGDCSASTMWDNSEWTRLPRNDNPLEPVYTNADYIQHLNPSIKIIFILRNPITRLYSDYLYFEKESRKSPANFHWKVVDAIHIFTACFRATSLKSCVYNKIIQQNLQVRLHVGIYFIYLIEWYKKFPRHQILPMKLEQYSVSLNDSLRKLFTFLEMRMPEETWFHKMINSRRVNIRNNRNINVGSMWIETRQMLYKFYKPFNTMLAQLLRDKDFDFGFS